MANTNTKETSSDPRAQTSATDDSVAKKRRKTETATVVARAQKPKPEDLAVTKTEAVLKKLKAAKGVTLEALMEATGWQAHSVRGFLSGTVKKKLGHSFTSEPGKDGIRRYRIHDKTQA